MKNYFYLQLKKGLKIFPFVIAVTLALLIGLCAVLYGLLNIFFGSEANSRVRIAVTGDTDNEYMNLGMMAMQSFDQSRFSIEFIETTEEKAQKLLEKGNIAAYVIMPESFVENAISGEIEPITYVTSVGMEGVSDLFKKEVTTLVTDMVVYSQKGAYGLGEAFSDNNLRGASEHMDKISIEYAELIFNRNKLYSVEELGISDGLSTPEYYVCAITIMLFILIGLPFAAVYIKKDYAFNRLLLSRGYKTGSQIGFEYIAHFVTMLLQTATVFGAAFIALKFLKNDISVDVLTDFAIKIIPVVIMISAFNIMMFELSSNIVSGLLLHFFVGVGLAYISGCMYPIYVFPSIVRKISLFLPTGCARSYLATCFTYDSSFMGFLGLMIYTVVFFCLAWFLRFRKTVGIRG